MNQGVRKSGGLTGQSAVIWESRSFNVVGVGIDIFGISVECGAYDPLDTVIVDDVRLYPTNQNSVACADYPGDEYSIPPSQ